MNKAVYIGCAAGVLAASVSILCGAAAGAKANRRLGKSDFIKTAGRQIKNARGETVVLRGVNLGGWLLQEPRMCPNSGDDIVRGYKDTLTVLTERFGDEKANELINTRLNNWITADDLDRLKKLGVNCVRVPFTYRNFQSDNGTWLRNKDGGIDFSRLDWIVAEFGKRGVYVILNLHSAPGFQNSDCSCGKADASELFDCSLAGLKYRQRTAELWRALAEHFKGNPAVSAFDLLNEPMNGFPDKEKYDKHLWRFYNKLYQAVRKADPERMIMVQGVGDKHNLPDPEEFCWKNIVYQLHADNWTPEELDRKIADIIDVRANRNVPVLIGEFLADGIWEYNLCAFNENALSWCSWTYKGVKTAKKERFLFAGEIEDVNLQDDSFEQIKAKWGSLCRTSKSFIKNQELAAVLKKYLAGYVEPSAATPAGAAPGVSVEVFNADGNIPQTDEGGSADPFRFVYGTTILVGMGTLAELTKKKGK